MHHACEEEQKRGHWCVLGMQDLPGKLKNSPYLYIQLLDPKYDFGAIDCWYEELFNRTYLQPERGTKMLEEKFYTQMPHVCIREDDIQRFLL